LSLGIADRADAQSAGAARIALIAVQQLAIRSSRPRRNG